MTATAEQLDRVLALQLTVAWAGEAQCQPARLGWWRTDLVDEDGGYDLLRRLLPRTWQWAGLEAVREAARRADERARGKMANPDEARTLYHFGFHLDEQLAERLAEHKRRAAPPAEVLGGWFSVTHAFDAAAFSDYLTGLAPGPRVEVVPGGRKLKATPPAEPDMAAAQLARALLPLGADYPVPFFKVTP